MKPTEALLITICFSFYSNAYAVFDVPAMNVEGRFHSEFSVIDQGQKIRLQLPDEFAREIEGTYDNVRVEDITGDGVGEFIFSTEASASNSCSKVLRYNAIERSLTEIVFPIGPLCNFDARQGYIVSAYREGGAWREDIYHVSGARIKAALSDVCVGCGEVRRKKYAEDGSNIRLLVSDNVDFKERIELTAKVISSRANISFSGRGPTNKKILGAWR